MRTIIGIYGQPLVGKTTVAMNLVTLLPGFIIQPLSYPVKKDYCGLANITMQALDTRIKQDPTVRGGLSALRSKKSSSHWVKGCLEYPGCFIVDDLETEKDIDLLKEAADVFYLLKVEASTETIKEQDRGHMEGLLKTPMEEYDDTDFVIENDHDLEILLGQSSFAAFDITYKMIDYLEDKQRAFMATCFGIDIEGDEDDV